MRHTPVLFALSAALLAHAASAVDCTATRTTLAFTTCRVDLRTQTLRLFYADAQGSPYESFARLRASLAREHQRLSFAMNAGMFHPDMKPVGLLIIHGREFAPIVATQSGPMLVHHGQIPATAAFRAGSQSKRRRNGVCAPKPDVALLVISEDEVTFREFALYFRDVLGCNEALYLDGSISSLYSPALKRADARARLGPMFAVVE
jgi:uncharacterized protein YigE (DUF2233 family)